MEKYNRTSIQPGMNSFGKTRKANIHRSPISWLGLTKCNPRTFQVSNKFKLFEFKAFAIKFSIYFVSLGLATSSYYRPICGLETRLGKVAPYDMTVNPAIKIIMNTISTNTEDGVCTGGSDV